MINRKVILTVMLGAVCGSAMYASASALGEQIVETRVSVSHLDLSDAAGQQQAYKSLKKAAHQVCGPQFYRQAGSLTQARLNKTCYEEAIADAVERLDNRGVNALHEST